MRSIGWVAWRPDRGRAMCRVTSKASAQGMATAVNRLRALPGKPQALAVEVFIKDEPVGDVDCPGHRPVQHRDRKPPWCDLCGRP